MRKEVILVTGVNGEMGHGLIPQLEEKGDCDIIGLDVQSENPDILKYCTKFIQGDILDEMLLGRLVAEYEIRSIYHLASILSTKEEYNPITAHKVNVEGTLNLLRLAVEQSQWQGRPVRFIYPSSIAVYGIPNIEIKNQCHPINENQYLNPTTVYGCNKLYCEHLGRYFSKYYRQLAADNPEHMVDFRCIRFPGLISPITLPTGGTSDYAPEILHSSASGKPYQSFVREDTIIPFMVMSDAIKSLIMIEEVDKESLSQSVYNVTSFSLTAEQIVNIATDSFPKTAVTYNPSSKRQAIVDTWPAKLDDRKAQLDWNWKPDYPLEKAFVDHLIPMIKSQYK